MRMYDVIRERRKKKLKWGSHKKTTTTTKKKINRITRIGLKKEQHSESLSSLSSSSDNTEY